MSSLARFAGLRVHFRTFGCQMNENDSERLSGLLAAEGAVAAEGPESSDVVIVNTCAVRAKSEEKLFSYLGRLGRLRRERGLVVGVAGCVAQLHKGALVGGRAKADFVIGPDRYADIGDVLARGLRAAVVATDRVRGWREPAADPAPGDHPGSAYVTIMEGCDSFCAYCVVPFARGRERHRPLGRILAEAATHVRRGCLEIQLLGQNVNAWRDPGSGADLAALLEAVAGIEGLARIRFLTSHPKSFGPRLVEAMARLPRVCRQLHLPVQAGATSLLARMRRGYTRDEYLALVEALRRRLPDLSLSTDIIVGFPGETEAEFRQTLDLLAEVRFATIFSFRYSPRPLTAAARMADDVPPAVKRDRLLEVQRLQKSIQAEINAGFVGRTIEVLATGTSARDPRVFSGRAEGGQVVNFASAIDPIGRLVRVRVTSSGPFSLRGEAIPGPAGAASPFD